jgi:hypothetical protein
MTIDCTDMNDIKLLNPSIEDSDDGSGSDSSSNEDVKPRLTARDVKRHYWHKGNIKYWYAMALSCLHASYLQLYNTRFVYQGRKHYMTAEPMVTRFPGTGAALWKFCDDKEPGTISEFRIMEYFRLNGHEGPLREMLYHLLPRRLFRMLMQHQADGTLDQFFF